MISKTTQLNFRLLTSLLFFLCSTLIFAEGTAQLDPNATDYTKLLTNDAAYASFAMYNGPINSRLNIHIADPDTEQVYLGFSRGALENFDGNGDYIGESHTVDYYFRIRLPQLTWLTIRKIRMPKSLD